MECGCNSAYIGPSLAYTCQGGAFILFMQTLDIIIRKTCDVSELCQRVVPRLRPDEEYDFVVIGGGTTGSVVAGRLSEVPEWKVLVIEAGSDEPPGVQVPSMMSSFNGNPDVDWNLKSEPESNACRAYPESRCTYPRGKALGGSSVLNGMMYARGVPQDYDAWLSAGNTGWGYNDLLPYFLKSEDNEEIGTMVEEKYHGRGGPLTITRFPYQPEILYDIRRAGEELGYPSRDDLNGKDLTGFWIGQSNVKNGGRLSMARAYLRPARDRPNLHIMLNSTATKILISQNGPTKSASAVEFVFKNQLYRVRVKKEVIVSAGAFQSPQLLLLSGIGPKQDLEKVGIKQMHELPGVGKNLLNHVSFGVTYQLKKVKATRDLDWKAVHDYIHYRNGSMGSTGLSQLIVRLNSKYADPSGKHPDLQLYFDGYLASCSLDGFVGAPENPNKPDAPKEIVIRPVTLHPKSTGYVGLKSNSPFDPPMIVPNYFDHPEDIAVLIEGVRLTQRLASTNHLQERYGIERKRMEYGDCGKKHQYDSDEFWDCAIRYLTSPENHPAGSCKMGPASDPMAVVNPQLQVYGIDNLRVMDSSIMPSQISGGIQITCVLIGEKGADFIKQKWLKGYTPNLPNKTQ